MSSELANPEFHERLSRLIGNEKAYAWAGKVGISKGAFSRIWKDGTVPSPDLLIRIKEATGASIDWLLTGAGEMFPGLAGAGEQSGGDPEDDYVFVPVMQGKISAGGGLMPDTTIEMKAAFQRDWIERRGDYKNMSLIRVRGDSMAPTFLEGDIILVNHSIKTVTANGGIYAITFNDEIIVKRIEVVYPSGQWKVKSDNPEYDSFVVEPSQVIVNGKVIWYARSLER